MSSGATRKPLPVTVVTGALGAGKTTLIARLMANKPQGENWTVLLNEFTESGIDALTVAAQARGRYDVRLVAGGCLCCTGEQDFRRNLREVLAAGGCDRLIVEPSGAGHPAGMIEELLAHQAQGALRIEAILGLVDPQRLATGAALQPGLTRDQLDIADALVLTKSDLASAQTATDLQSLQQSLFPSREVLDATGIDVDTLRAVASTGMPRVPAQNGAGSAAAHDGHHVQSGANAANAGATSQTLQLADGMRRSSTQLLGLGVANWVMVRGAIFDEGRLRGLLGGSHTLVQTARRIKGVFQVGEDAWVLAQRSASGCSITPSSWRRDSRMEVLTDPGTDWIEWDALWQACRSTAGA